MGRKPKTGSAEAQRTDPAQSERFVKAAREAGVDESGEAFERAFGAVAAPGRTAAPGDAPRRDAPKKKRPAPRG